MNSGGLVQNRSSASTLILFFLRDGPKRYGELKRLIAGVSDKVLIQSLKGLEADQVLARADYKKVPLAWTTH